MNWDDLRVFLHVAREESLSGAARRLRLDPATLGRRIARLEQATGVVLFAKSPRGYALTPAGERLRQQAEKAEAALAGAGEAGGSGLAGVIRIGAPDGCANFLLPQVCAAIREENPDLEVQIVALPRVFNLSRREADMAIAVTPPQTGRMAVQKITDYRLHLAASEHYLAEHGPIDSAAALRSQRIVGYLPDMIFDKGLDYMEEIGAGRLDFGSNSVSVQFRLVMAGAGVGVVHDFALPFGPGLRRVLVREVSLRRSFYLVRPADDRRVERLNRFAAALSEGLRAEVARLEALVDAA